MLGLLTLLVLGVRLTKQLRLLVRDESAQDTIEYIVLAGTVAVAIAAALIVGFGFIIPEVLGTTCPSVDPLGSTGSGDCIDP
jgi:Flp pilus assembly pilin Flp